MKNTTLILIRGIPGSGKSTLAKELIEQFYGNIVHYEADMWHYNSNHEYDWKECELKNAHKFCQLATQKALECGTSVIVSNTNLYQSSINQYKEIAKNANVRIIIIRCLNEYNNIHNVPELQLESMRKNVVDIMDEIYYKNDKFYFDKACNFELDRKTILW